MSSELQLKRGKVFIFNYMFEKEPANRRDGSEKDVEELVRTFKHLNADVVEPFQDLPANGVRAEMQKIKSEDFTEYDYVVIVVGSHGTENSIVDTGDQKYIYLRRTFLVPLYKNKTLSKKLKWIITQTCRGAHELHTETSEYQKKEGIDPRYYLISFPTIEGFGAYRDLCDGSFFIQNLCKELQEHYHDEDILSILDRTHQSVLKECESKTKNMKSQKTSNEENFGHFSFTFFNNNTLQETGNK